MSVSTTSVLTGSLRTSSLVDNSNQVRRPAADNHRATFGGIQGTHDNRERVSPRHPDTYRVEDEIEPLAPRVTTAAAAAAAPPSSARAGHQLRVGVPVAV